MMSDKIYNIPLSCAFLDTLAALFLEKYRDNPLALSDILFLLPNRRSCKALSDAFIRLQGLKPTILPQMQPLMETPQDELLLSGCDVSREIADIPASINATERLMLFTKLIMSKPSDYGLDKMPAGQAVALAGELASLVDQVYNLELSFSNLQNIVPEEYAVHWQETLKFLQIIMTHWPDILADQGKIDEADRNIRLLKAELSAWQDKLKHKKIIVAGTTAAFPIMKELVKTVLQMENGEVYLYGIDKYLSADDWETIDELHPQYELKQLLDYLELNRMDISDIAHSDFPDREVLLSEVMRPAVTSDKWRRLNKDSFAAHAFDGLHFINAPDIRTEALSIALIMRESLNAPEKTAALVTTDRNLARRVAAELSRWQINVDDSAGVPLTLKPVGIFLRQILETVEQNLSPVSALALMKYPLYGGGRDRFEMRRSVRAYEKSYRQNQEQGEKDVIKELSAMLSPLLQLYAQDEVSLAELLQVHIQTAEALTATNEKSGDKILWRGDDGEAAARFMADQLDHAEVIGKIKPCEYSGWLTMLMSRVPVRNRYDMHPQLKILGPIEARLQRFDCVIIGEVNETMWPLSAGSDPWMSRPMKREFGLPVPEKNIGVLAADFAALASGREIYITRAERVQGVPMVKSRWWMRFQTVLLASEYPLEQLLANKYQSWAEALDKKRFLQRLNPPAPKPPLEARPRQLSATDVDKWVRDPYYIFAKHILKLKPLDPLEQEWNFADYGTIVHEILKEFNNKYNHDYPQNAKSELLAIGERFFAENEIAVEMKAFWWQNFVKTVDWIVQIEQEYRSEVATVHSEISGSFTFRTTGGDFAITAKADRVDIRKDGKINILDYKTGKVRENNDIENTYAPQLPIEGIIARLGGFADVPAAGIEKLLYWRLGKEVSGLSENVDEVLDKTQERLQSLVEKFDSPETPYLNAPDAKYALTYTEYEQLSRWHEINFAQED